MIPTRIHAAARELSARARPGTPDADLLARFLDARDHEAFAELAVRHGPAVLAVCRAVLRDPHDADDAAQATFLVLVRRAASVRDRAALGAWLCRVAWRAANRLRADNARRAARGSGVDPDSTAAREPNADALARAAVMDEVGRLPEVYRTAVLACYAGGASTAEAARQLGWPKGTLLTRLAWARKRLSARLASRGVTLGGGLAGAFAGRVGPATAARLAERVTPVAVALATGEPVGSELVSERVLPLTNGVVRAMAGTKLKAALGVGILAAVLLGLGLGRATVGTAGADPGDGKRAAAPVKAEPAAPLKGAKAAQDDKVEPAEDAPNGVVVRGNPGKELVVRRPTGSYTREAPPFGRSTITFTEDRLNLYVVLETNDGPITVSLDADYSINRESLLFGVVTNAEIDANADLALELGQIADIPFAFRVRAEGETLVIKDVKFGPFGSPVWGNKGDTPFEYLAAVSGKFQRDPDPGRKVAPPARPRRNAPPARNPGPQLLPQPQPGAFTGTVHRP